MAQDGLDHRLRIALFAQHGGAHKRVLVERRMLFIIHVVQQPRHAPNLDVLAEVLGVVFHGGFDGVGVAA